MKKRKHITIQKPSPVLVQTPKPAPHGNIFLAWHLGLGEAVVCNGLVRTLLERFENIILPVRSKNRPSVQFMFRDTPRIKLCTAANDTDQAMQERIWLGNGYQSFPLGKHKRKQGGLDLTHWDKMLYEDAEVPFENRWLNFYFQRETLNEFQVTHKPYVFLHRDISRSIHVNPKYLPKLHTVEPSPSEHIFKWCSAIEGASEIHCVDSAFLALADSLRTTALKKMCHAYARRTVPPTLSEGWQTV